MEKKGICNKKQELALQAIQEFSSLIDNGIKLSTMERKSNWSLGKQRRIFVTALIKCIKKNKRKIPTAISTRQLENLLEIYNKYKRLELELDKQRAIVQNHSLEFGAIAYKESQRVYRQFKALSLIEPSICKEVGALSELLRRKRKRDGKNGER